MDGNKLNNDPTNLYILTNHHHRKIEAELGSFGKQLLAPGMPPMPIHMRETVIRSLSPFRRLLGLFVQKEIYDKWRREKIRTDWPEGSKAEWEMSQLVAA